MENRLIWDTMSRFERHSRAGAMMMAISAVDNALWDLKGKILGQPVYKILGGGRDQLKVYTSMLGFSTEPKKAAERAKWMKDKGVQAQKWFFSYGPNDGIAGMRKNLDMAFAVREALGYDYELMFDCWMGWDIAYAKQAFRELAPVKPMWVEEVLRPHMQDGYARLKEDTDMPLSAGEHLYTRMEVNSYLKAGIFDVIQSDPEWCGGITETMRIVDLCETYGTRMIPHGHLLLPCMHIVAAQSPQTCPYVEYLVIYLHGRTFMVEPHPLAENGTLTMPQTPGLGGDFDMAKVISSEQITELKL
jgi:L-alanine-DL-glutamate epimerase-like enolase superfamily enzyme